MALNLIKAQLVILLDEVTGVENIHDRMKSIHTIKGVWDYLRGANNNVNSWMITRGTTGESLDSNKGSGVVNIRIHKILIKGFYSVSDSDNSEGTFQDLIEAVCAKLRENHTLNGTAFTSNPPQVDEVKYQQRSNQLLHMCTISLMVQEYIIYSTS
jgi:hypothetical protein